MLNKKIIPALMATFLLLFAISCSTFQDKWNTMTKDEQQRVIITGIQTELETLFDIGRDYVVDHPEKQEVWMNKVIPAFDSANKMVYTYIILIGKGEATIGEAIDVLYPLVKSIANLLSAIGVPEQEIENVIEK